MVSCFSGVEGIQIIDSSVTVLVESLEESLLFSGSTSSGCLVPLNPRVLLLLEEGRTLISLPNEAPEFDSPEFS